MKKLSIAVVILIALFLSSCGPKAISSLSLKPDDSVGIVFGRILPIYEANNGYLAFERPGGSLVKCEMTADGYFALKNKAGRVRLIKVGYEDSAGVQTITLSTPAPLSVVGGRVTYVGQIIIAPHARDVYLTDDFIRDRNWLRDTFADDVEPNSAFPNQSFYRLMERFAAVPAPMPRLENGRVYIEGGEFLMGDVWPGNLVQAFGTKDLNQVPPHRVRLSPYRLDAYPVAASALNGRGDKPAVNVSWAEANAYCRAQGGRLPTEAEYELALRGPAWGDHLYAGAPHPGQPPALGGVPAVEAPGWTGSPYGVKAQASGLAEWTADWYGANTYRTDSATDPIGPVRGSRRVVRAGPYRFAVLPDAGHRGLGFRCAYPEASETRPPVVEQPAETPAPAVKPVPEKQPANLARANREADLFAGPSAEAAIIGRVQTGTALTVLATSGNFTLVRMANGDEGFVRVDVVEATEGE